MAGPTFWGTNNTWQWLPILPAIWTREWHEKRQWEWGSHHSHAMCDYQRFNWWSPRSKLVCPEVVYTLKWLFDEEKTIWDLLSPYFETDLSCIKVSESLGRESPEFELDCFMPQTDMWPTGWLTCGHPPPPFHGRNQWPAANIVNVNYSVPLTC